MKDTWSFHYAVSPRLVAAQSQVEVEKEVVVDRCLSRWWLRKRL